MEPILGHPLIREAVVSDASMIFAGGVQHETKRGKTREGYKLWVRVANCLNCLLCFFWGYVTATPCGGCGRGRAAVPGEGGGHGTMGRSPSHPNDLHIASCRLRRLHIGLCFEHR